MQSNLPTSPDSKTAVSATSTVADNRREKRLHIAVPVKVFMDAQGTECEACCTFEISMVGARLMRFQGAKQIGQTVWLQRHGKRAKYKVIWIGEHGTRQAGQVGVEVLEPGNIIWENELRLRMMQQS